RRRHTRFSRDWSSDVCSSDLSTGAFTDAGGYEPRIYFSPEAPQYSIVGAPEGREPWELDYPVDDEGGQVNNTFPTQEIAAGPSVGTFLNKVLYALKRSEERRVGNEA